MNSNGNDTDLSDYQLLQLGRVAYWSAAIESSLREMVTALSSRDPYNDEQLVRLLVRGAPVAELDRLIRSLLEHVSPSDEDKQYIRDRLAMARVALASRNHLLHGTWITAADGQNVIVENKGGLGTSTSGTYGDPDSMYGITPRAFDEVLLDVARSVAIRVGLPSDGLLILATR